ncbi:GntR family transcriptional regulator [Alkalicoccus halolimnae]|uniref:GntR family transcriptional regulator n=1 Tax=Alkalicoccus halolimnae TaxID=1667239 RepID=A0AAJ8N2Q9_9BACI|nr:GntR family transcriptional regulator [Alkalicoccus halolimnae]
MNQKQKKLPLYVQIKNKLTANIKDGTWKPGDSLPSESQMIEQYNVSRTTIRQAIRELVQNGTLEISRGAPAKVKKIPEEGIGNPGIIHHETGTEMSVIILRMEKSQAHYAAKYQLSLPETAEVFFMERLRIADGSPIAVQRSYFPLEVGQAVEEAANKEFDYFPALGEHGIHHKNIKEHVSAANAAPYEADLLGITPGEALITIERTTLGIDAAPIEYSLTKYTPKAFNYTIEIE